ncbi:MAG: acetyltransferase protein [Rhizobium sp.]|nr:acetyltransferase protein [Rhizobium sp.]
MALVIRDVRAGDEQAWRALWAGYLAFYKVDVPDDVTDFTWKRLLDPSLPMAMRVAEQEGELAGFAIHLTHPSTWVMNHDCYLEDLYLDDRFRGAGIGRALLDDLVALCEKNGWSRLYWHTDEDNVRARKLYDSYVKSDGHVRYRMKFPGVK